MTASAPMSHTLRIADLRGRSATPFDLCPDAAARAALAADLGLLGLPGLRFSGAISPTGRRDLVLSGQLTATVVQPCVVTLDPVTTRISETVERRYVEDYLLPEGDEVEIPDDTVEPLPLSIDLGAIVAEALALALPPYPRVPGAELGQMVHAGQGVTPLRDADLRPFAGLARLAGRDVPDAGEGDADPPADDTDNGRTG